MTPGPPVGISLTRDARTSLLVRAARVDRGAGVYPPHEDRRPQADLLTGEPSPHAGAAWGAPASCLAALPPLPQNNAALTDNAGPGRGRKRARRERVTRGLLHGTSRRSPMQRAGINALQRRPQADNTFRQAFARQRGRSEPPGAAGTRRPVAADEPPPPTAERTPVSCALRRAAGPNAGAQDIMQIIRRRAARRGFVLP